jgi:DNA-binding CsgD family transcriptional regulator
MPERRDHALLDATEALLEREAELAEIDALIDRCRHGSGGVLVLEGPPGIGKTQLLSIARARARHKGAKVLFARCTQLERDFDFGLIRQLFEPPIAAASADQRAALLGGAAQLAAPLLGDLPLTTVVSTNDNLFNHTLRGLYRLTAKLAEHDPLLLIVDDAHWSDPASLRFLDFLVRRIEELPIGLLLTVRPGGPRPDDPGAASELLTPIRRDPVARILRPVPLSLDAVATLLQIRVGVEPEDRFAQACHTVTGGNPFLLHELASELVQQGIHPTAEHTQHVWGLGPRSVSHAVFTRLRWLPPAASALAMAVAVLGEDVEFRHAAELADLDLLTTAQTADALVQEDILAPGRPLRFVHSIVRAAVYAELPHAERAQYHHRAAALFRRDGWPPEQIAAHLFITDPSRDPTVVETLRQAASRALAKGNPEASATWLRRALNEPPSAEVRSDVLLELCLAEARLPGRELEHLRNALELIDDRKKRAVAALELARVTGIVAESSSAANLLDRVITDVRFTDTELALRLQAGYISLGRLYPATRAHALTRLASLRSQATPDHHTGSVLLANLALSAVEKARPASEAAELAEQALEGGSLLAQECWTLAYAINTLTWTERVHEAERAWTDVLRHSQQRGSKTMFILALTWRSHLAFRRGMIAEAEEDARLCLDICREHGWRGLLSYVLAFMVDALRERGELDRASHLMDDCPFDETLPYPLSSRGRLRCAQGRPWEGLADLLEAGRQLDARGIRNPAIVAWRSSAAMVLAQLHKPREARRLADEEVKVARAFGAPGAYGIALRVRATLEQGWDRIERLREATQSLEASPARLEHARALIQLGAALHRVGRRSEAQEHLRHGLDLAHRCNATALCQQAHTELLASGSRPQRFALVGVEALTPSERRVADMAAEGLGNREIAQALFVSRKTVEAHLSSTYRKLGLTSRLQLRNALT